MVLICFLYLVRYVYFLLEYGIVVCYFFECAFTFTSITPNHKITNPCLNLQFEPVSHESAHVPFDLICPSSQLSPALLSPVDPTHELTNCRN